MSYISAALDYRNDQVMVWERNEGVRSLVRYPAPYYFFYEDPDGKYTSMYGDKLSKMTCRSRDQFTALVDSFKRDGMRLYESDIAPDLKVISQKYYFKETPTIHTTYYDIEVDYDPKRGFSSVNDPYAPINAIALYHDWSQRTVILAVPPDDQDCNNDEELLRAAIEQVCPTPNNGAYELYLYKSEAELLERFIDEIDDTDLILGWNSESFDNPYVGKRIQIALGDDAFKRLSFRESNRMPTYREFVSKYGSLVTTLDLHGRIASDYMALFKKYEMSMRMSYKLEAIADEVCPDLPKLKYSGSLADLYANDFAHFLRYNIRDTEILVGMERALGYVDLANKMYHMSGAMFKHVTGTVKLVEMAIINETIHHFGKRIRDTAADREDGSIQGAYVLYPQIGLHEYIGAIDINSLYPTAIRSINISPETLVGQFISCQQAFEAIYGNSNAKFTLRYEDGSEETLPAAEWRDVLWNRKWAVSGFGTVFRQDEPGIIPTILTRWFAQRKEYQGDKKGFEAKIGEIKKRFNLDKKQSVEEVFDRMTADEIAEYKELKKNAEYYDKLQYIFKIKLNSTYGALTNFNFKFFDLRMGESTTATGRFILRHQVRKIGELLDGEYWFDPIVDVEEYENRGRVHPSPSIVYGDTDSCYFTVPADTVAEAVKMSDVIADQVNKSYEPFMIEAFRCQPEYSGLVKAARELVADRGIFVNKKRYTLHVVDKEGKPADELKTMGLELKKTTLPKYVQDELSGFIERLLKGETWDDIAYDVIMFKRRMKQSVTAEDIIDLGLPKGANKLEHYTAEYKRTRGRCRLPGHIAAAIYYNQLREAYEDTVSIPIISGSKVRVFYLATKQGKFKSVALPGDMEEVPDWFSEDILPLIDHNLQIEKLVDDPLEKILKAIETSVPQELDLVVKSAIVFH